MAATPPASPVTPPLVYLFQLVLGLGQLGHEIGDLDPQFSQLVALVKYGGLASS